MANITTAPGLLAIDPIQGLVDYVTEFKPYHTKIFDVLFEYVFTDDVNLTFAEFGEAISFNWSGYNIVDSTISIVSISGNQIVISGNYLTGILSGDSVQVEDNTATTVTSVTYNSTNNQTTVTLNNAPTVTTLPLTLTVNSVDITKIYSYQIASVQPANAEPSQSPLTLAKTNTNNIIALSSSNLNVPSITVSGNATMAVQVGAKFLVQGSINNNGLYYAAYLQYEPFANTTTIGCGVVSGVPTPSLTAGGGGQVVPYRYFS